MIGAMSARLTTDMARYESIHNNIIPQQSKAEAIGRNKFSASSCRGLEKQKLAMKILQIGFQSDGPFRLFQIVAMKVYKIGVSIGRSYALMRLKPIANWNNIPLGVLRDDERGLL
jgi:hypothetical protein